MAQLNKMRNLAACFILLVLLGSTVNAEKYFVLDINYLIGYVTFNSISLREISTQINNDETSGFLAKTVSFGNKDIEKKYYAMSENKNYFLYLPYSKDAARIEVYNLQNSKVIDLDVTSFANTCGDDICEPHESYESCTKDCPSGGKDDFCDAVKDGICDSDCSQNVDPDCEKDGKTGKTNTPSQNSSKIVTPLKDGKTPIVTTAKKQDYFTLILLASLAFAALIGILFFLLIKKRRNDRNAELLRGYIRENVNKGFTLQQVESVLFRQGYSQKEIENALKPT